MHTFVQTHEGEALNLAHVARFRITANETARAEYQRYRLSADVLGALHPVAVGPPRNTHEGAQDDHDRLLQNIGNLIAVGQTEDLDGIELPTTSAGHVIRTNWLAERDDR